jgi:sugar/nucleoside kinase (ribokinase family)
VASSNDGRQSTRSGQAPLRQPLAGSRSMAGMQSSRTPEYLVIGHICGDIQADGKVVLGGTALYSAITAARLGWRTAVLTRGVFGREVAGYEIPSLEEYADEISIIVQDAETTTMFVNEYTGGRRTQKLPQWAGPIDLRGLPPHWRNARIIHLGPIAQEIDTKQTGALTPFFLGATPQGWMRDWPKPAGGKVTHNHLRLSKELVSRLDCIIVSQEEIALCRDTVEAVGVNRLGVITMGQDGAKVIYGGHRANIPAFKVDVADHTGAGDTFAAAFFIGATDRAISAPKAARFASATSGMSLREVGMHSIPSRTEVDTFMRTAEELPIKS